MNILTILLVLAAAVVVWLAWRMAPILLALARMRVPPARIHLVPDESPAWRSVSRVAELVTSLHSMGFTPYAAYSIPEMPGLRMVGLGLSEEQIMAAVYEHPLAGVWCDVCLSYENGNGLTVTNAPMGGEMDSRPGQERVADKEANAERLVELLRARRRPEPCKPVGADLFVQSFEEAYAKEMDWRMSRGGVTLDEVRRTAQNMDTHYTEEQIQQAHQQLVEQYRAQQEEEDSSR